MKKYLLVLLALVMFAPAHAFAADRYWVGGTGNWSDDDNHWATTSGGAPADGNVPTAADNCIFDTSSSASNAAYTVTVTNSSATCLDFTMDGPDPADATKVTLTGFPLVIKGSLNLSGGTAGINWTYLSTITFSATSGTQVITSNGIVFTGSMVFNNPGATTQLADAFQWSRNGSSITYTAGTFDPNGQTATFYATGAGTSATIIGDFTFYNLVLAGGTNTAHALTGSVTVQNDLTWTPGVQARFTIAAGETLTVGGTLTQTASSKLNRPRITSDTEGTAATIDAAAVSFTDINFADITAAGAAAPFTGTRLGDARGNTNITTDAPKTVYWVGNTATWGTTSNVFATSSGGAGSDDNYPLPQDTAIFDSNSFSANDQVVTINSINIKIPKVDFSAITETGIRITFSNTSVWYGDITLEANMNTTGTGAMTLSGRNNQIINTAGVTLSNSLTITSPGSSVVLGADLTATGMTLTMGTLDLNGNDLTLGSFNGSGTNIRGITSNGGSITVTGTGTAWTINTATNFSSSGDLTVTATYGGASSMTVQCGTMSEANSISFVFNAGTYNLALNGSMRNVDFTGWAGTFFSISKTVYGNWTMGAGATISVANGATFAATSGTKTITTNGVTHDMPITFSGVGGTWQLADDMVIGSTRTTTLTAGTLDVNGNDLTTGIFSSSGSGVREIKSTVAGGSIRTISESATTVFTAATPTNLTVTRNSWTIEIGGNTTNTRTFAGGGATWPTVIFSNTTAGGRLNFTGSNTFKSLVYNGGTAQTIGFTAGTNTTIEDNNGFPSGTPGNLLTIGSITASSHTLTKSGGGAISSDYLSISRSTATPGTTWFAGFHSTDGGNNSGWTFGQSSPSTSYTTPAKNQLRGGFFRFFGGAFRIR